MDLRFGLALLAGSWSTAIGAIYATRILARGGHFDTVVVFTYITILGTVGTVTFAESIRAVFGRAAAAGAHAATVSAAGPLAWLPGQIEFKAFPRLETRTKESNMSASFDVENIRAK